MNKLFLLLAFLPMCALAQTADANPMSTWLRGAFTGNKNNILRSAEKMPEENYAMRPGSQMEVRTFGQQVAHAATYSYLWCSQAKGEKNPSPGNLEKLTSKAEIMKAAADAFAYCESAYAALTDSSGAEMVEITQENGRTTRTPRMGLLTLNYSHNNEVYGSMVVYMRMKNMSPQPERPQQKQ